MKILFWSAVVIVLAFNMLTAKLYSAKEMKEDFIDGQCVIGKIAANIFYAPAWLLKLIRFCVVKVVK